LEGFFVNKGLSQCAKTRVEESRGEQRECTRGDGIGGERARMKK
jgi:hypothetical protein